MNIRTAWIGAGVLGLILLHALVVYGMGQPFMCACGHIELWHGIVTDSENSQHLTDWYTLSHFIHGVLFYALLTLFFPRIPMSIRLFLAIGIEMSWEMFENTDFIINRYREQALAQGYFGDSVVNSVGDVVAAIIGFLFAWRFPVWTSIVVVIVLELLALYVIRDNLTLNIIQLIHPVDAIGVWQAGK